MITGRVEKIAVTAGVWSAEISGTFALDQIVYSFDEINSLPLKKGQEILFKHEGNVMLDATAEVWLLDTSNAKVFSYGEIFIKENFDLGAVYRILYDNCKIAVISKQASPHAYNVNFRKQLISEQELIDNPIDLIKHVKQLQNWSELGVSYQWGLEFVPEAKIKLSGEGSFNSDTLAEHRNLRIAHQFFEYDRAWSDDIVHNLCEQFFLVSYQDNNGYECIKSILTKENPATVITFADILGDVGDMIEPLMQNIHCLPIINYAYDYATEKYLNQIRIENVWEDTFLPEYAIGLNETDGLEIWTTCKRLWAKTRQIEPMPSNLSDREWVVDYDTAVWCLKNQLQIMEIKRCSLNVGWLTGRFWDVGKHFKLQLPHQTNNNEIECVVEQITKNKNNNRVNVQVMLLDSIESSFFFEE